MTDPLHRYTITGEGASPGYFRLVEDAKGAWVAWAEVKAHLAALDAELTRLRWQPIATAPEGEYVMVWLPNYGEFPAVRTDRDWWQRAGGFIHPTHWMPLPVPPTEAK